MNEINRIKERYQRRIELNVGTKYGRYFIYNYFVQCERELKYSLILKKEFKEKDNIKFIEIGAGYGNNINFFIRYGIKKSNIYINEILPERFQYLQDNYNDCNLEYGNALDLNYQNKFDFVFQSTVFTSILDMQFKKMLANKMINMTKPGGFILWYDFKFNNPANKDVRGISKNEIKSLFPYAKKIEFKNVTLAPPVGRKLEKWYNIINTFLPFLRTHIIAIIYK